MSRTRQSKSRAVRTNPTQGEHYEQAMEYVQTPLSVQLPRRRDDPNLYSNTHEDLLNDHSKRGTASSSQGCSASATPSQFHPSNPASFANLQIDLLIMIFKFFLAPINVSYLLEITKRRTTLLLLNSAFNNLVNSTPSLWAYVPISGPVTNHTRAQRSLERAGGIGLWWVFDLRNDNSSPHWVTVEVISALLKRYLTPKRMEQTTHLHIILNTSHLFPTVFRELRFPAPVLQEFKIVRGYIEYEQQLDVPSLWGFPLPKFRIEDGVLGGHAPALRLLQMHHTPRNNSQILAIFKCLTNGGGPRPNIQYLDLSQQQEIHPNLFYDLLESISTSLKTLVLRNAGPGIESEESTPDPLSPVESDGQQGLKRESRTYAIALPSLTSLVIGGMTANYLASLLSTLHFRPLTSLGVHGISPEECERIWNVLSQQPALLSPPTHCAQEGHSNRAFGSIGTLELFELFPSPEMGPAYPRPLNGKARKSSKVTGFHEFLVGQESLERIMMRKVGVEFVRAIAGISHPENQTIDTSSLIPAPSLECLEVCCIVDLYVDGDVGEVVPEILGEVVTALVDVLHARLDCAHRIGRLHLDGDEWAMRKGLRDNLIKHLAPLGEEGRAPIVHWDARAPFFADYYDSEEI